MNEFRAGLNVKELKRLRTARKLSATALSKLCRFEDHYISRVEKSEWNLSEISIWKIVRIAEVLRVPWDRLVDAQCPAKFEVVDWSNLDQLKYYLQEMGDAKSCLTCTQGIDSYVLPDEMVRWSEQSRLKQINWKNEKERLDGWMDYVKEQRTVRRKQQLQSAVHRIIAGESFFDNAFSSKLEWIDDLKSSMQSLEEHTAVGLVRHRQWPEIHQFIARITNFPTWDKISVADTNLAMIRPTREQFLFTHDRELVKKIRAGLEQATKFVEYTFPTERTITPSVFAKTVAQTTEKLEDIVRRKKPA